MDESTTREKVMKRIRNALINKLESPFHDVDLETPVTPTFTEDAEVIFAQEFTRADGMFVYCEGHEHLIELLNNFVSEKGLLPVMAFEERIHSYLELANIPFTTDEAKLSETRTAIVFCEALVARTGSIVVSSKQASGRRLPVIPEVLLVIAYPSQVCGELKDALNLIRSKYEGALPSQITFITGPSRTADIEKTLVKGVHGPKEVYLFFVDEL
jgi:L-lactate dehydrogenase complex protein LldG